MGAISEVGFASSELDSPNGVNKEEEVKFFNYITEMQKLVAQIFMQLGRISSNDHEVIEKMKEQYWNATMKSANLQMDNGRVKRNLAIAAFGIFFFRVGFPNADDKEIVGVISQQTTNFGGMWTSTIESRAYEAGNKSTIELEKYRSKTAKTQSEGNAKQDYVALLQSVGENQKSASRASG